MIGVSRVWSPGPLSKEERTMPVMPSPMSGYPDAEVVWSEHFADEGVGVQVATNLWDDADETVPDFAPIRVRVTTEDGTGCAYLTMNEAYELVHLLGNAIMKAKLASRSGE